MEELSSEVVSLRLRDMDNYRFIASLYDALDKSVSRREMHRKKGLPE